MFSLANQLSHLEHCFLRSAYSVSGAKRPAGSEPAGLIASWMPVASIRSVLQGATIAAGRRSCLGTAQGLELKVAETPAALTAIVSAVQLTPVHTVKLIS